MENTLTYIDTSIDQVATSDPSKIIDFSEILKAYNLTYQHDGYYLQVGQIVGTQGWILHLSCVVYQLHEVYDIVIPILVAEDIPFKIPDHAETASDILHGQKGFEKLGKILSIYPANDQKALSVGSSLIAETKHLVGPVVLTDFLLGGILYTRYGAFNSIKQTGPSSITENYIYDKDGNLIKDSYSIPPMVPAGREWPFATIAQPVLPHNETVFQDKFKPTGMLKNDLKGNVYKGLYLKGFINVKAAVAKEGIKNMWSDEYKRDIRDRLLWQKELQEELSSYITVPHVYDFFEENGNTYLIMEFIKGSSLYDMVFSIIKERHFSELSQKDQLQLIEYAHQLVELVGKMHQVGYVHRDINLGNFLVSKKNQIVPIDMELSYSIPKRKPYPPFRLGTPGYMSPEQLAAQKPTVKEDIYAIGASLITILTGLSPVKFEIHNLDTLTTQLRFFIPETAVVELISACMEKDPSQRPGINQIIERLGALRNATQAKSSVPVFHYSMLPSIEEIKVFIQNALNGLMTRELVNPDKLWTSKTIQEPGMAYYQLQDMSVYRGFAIGLSGILYILGKAAQCGYSLETNLSSYERAWEYIKTQYPGASLSLGLFSGTAGIACAMDAGSTAGLLPGLPANFAALLQNPSGNDITLAQGVSGQGLALLKCGHFLDATEIATSLTAKVEFILKKQQKDGSWLTDLGNNTQAPIMGLSYGVSGIICFLLGYAEKYDDNNVKSSIVRGLDWLTKKVHSSYKELLRGKKIYAEFGLSDGIAGIALSFLQAFKQFQDNRYKQTAELLLSVMPDHPVKMDNTLGSGLAGIGEVYLEAAHTFQAPQWRDRAAWIVKCILNQGRYNQNGSIYWLVDGTSVTTADLFTGNSGLIHFLLRYAHPEVISNLLVYTNNLNLKLYGKEINQ